MDHEAQRKKRQEELEAKRKRLEEMRKLRQTRSTVTETTVEQTEVATPSQTAEQESVDDLVNSLLTSLPATVAEVAADSNDVTSAAAAAPPPVPLTRLEIAKQRAAELTTVVNVVRIDIAPIIVETYHKECQTDETADEVDVREEEAGHTPHRRGRADSNTLSPAAPPPANGMYCNVIISLLLVGNPFHTALLCC